MSAKPLPLKKLTLEDACSILFLELESKGSAKKTFEHYNIQIGKFRRWLEDQQILHIDDVDHRTIKLYLVQLQQTKLKPASVHAAYRCIRYLFNLLYQEDLITTNPMLKVSSPKVPKPVMRIFTDQELKRIYKAAEESSQRDLAIVMMMLSAGTRIGELVSLRAIDLKESGEAHIRKTKTHQERIVYFSKRAMIQLKKYHLKEYPGAKPTGTDKIFKNLSDSDDLTVSGAKQMFSRLRKASGVEGLSSHKLRHHFVSMAVKSRKISLIALGKLTGQSPAMLSHYTHLDGDLEEQHREIVDFAGL